MRIVIDGTEMNVSGERTFKSGSRGYFAGGKVTAENGKRYQVSCSVVEIGSKPLAGETRSASGAMLGEPTE